MKLCPECGESSRDDAKQCVCGRLFGFETPHALTHTVAIAPSQDISPYAASPTNITGKGVALGGGMGCFVGLATIGAGIILLFVPFIGWIIGPVLMLAGCAMPFVMAGMGGMGASGMLKGSCPYCGTVLAGKGAGITCGACHGRIIIRDQMFLPSPAHPLPTDTPR